MKKITAFLMVTLLVGVAMFCVIVTAGYSAEVSVNCSSGYPSITPEVLQVSGGETITWTVGSSCRNAQCIWPPTSYRIIVPAGPFGVSWSSGVLPINGEPITSPPITNCSGTTEYHVILQDMIEDVCDEIASIATGENDNDCDEIPDLSDNCPDIANPDQDNSDTDVLGDLCDNCPNDNNPLQEDADCDGTGDVCDTLTECTEDIDCDDDCDGIYNQLDNCVKTANPSQEDTCPPNGNSIGDACECEGDFDCDGDVDGKNTSTFKSNFGRTPFDRPCTNEDSCDGDFDCDQDCDGTDAALFKADFGRSLFNNPCPACLVGNWCLYDGAPFIKDSSDTGCLDASSQSSSDQEGECANEDRVTAEVVGNSIMVTNTVYFNCCSGVEVELTTDGNYLYLLTMENPPGSCFCICCFGVETEIAGLASGEYTVEMCWSDWGSGHDCETETVVVP